LNRVFPGEDPDTGATGPQGHAYLIWNNLWGNTSNVDVAVDLHTASTGSEAPMWVYADVRTPYVERLAKLAQPDVLKIDEGEPGSIETTFIEHGIPAITLELGSPKQWRKDLIQRGVDFLDRLLVDLQILPSNATVPYEPDLSKTYIGSIFHSLPSRFGGFVETLVNPLDDVEANQEVGIVRNAWGDVLETVLAPVAGKIHQISRDSTTEPGRDVVQMVYNSTDVPDCEAGCIISSRDPP
jgi:predicted deacylase